MTGTEISYNIIVRPRRKTASIIIREDNLIDVLVPSRMPARQIEKFVLSKRKWIDKKLHFNENIRQKRRPKAFVSGETYSFLGKCFQLRVLYHGSDSILLRNEDLIIHIENGLTEEQQSNLIRKRLLVWYKEQANLYFTQKVQYFAAKIGKAPSLTDIKNYKSRWGSCHHDGRVYFNWRLIMAPEWIIDYVVVHELCHLIHPNHSPDFWKLVETVMPTFRDAKIWLKTDGLTLDL